MILNKSYVLFQELRGIMQANVGTESRRQLNAMKIAVDEVYAKATGQDLNKANSTQNESNYLLQGGQNYKETVFVLDSYFNKRYPNEKYGTLFELKNLFHVRYDVRSTNGKRLCYS